MTSHTFRVVGSYKHDQNNRVTFSVDALNLNQVRSFVRAYVPEFYINSIKVSLIKEDQHFDFSVVNPCISATFHRGNRRTHGHPVRAMSRMTYRPRCVNA